MADGERLGASFSIDTTNLKAGLQQANRLIRESESEFKAAAAGMDDWSDSQEGLEAKIKSLSDITEIQKKKVDALKSEYKRLIDDGLDPTSKQAVELRTKINNEETALKKNEAELRKQTKALDELGNGADDAGESVKELGDDAKESSSKLDGLKSAAAGVVKGVAAIGAACVAGVSAFLALGESTKETQVAMAKLDNSFSTAGLSAEDASKTMNDLYGVLGDMDRSTEAANLLAKMSKNEKDLNANTRILTGVFAEFGDSIPTEGLAEGMQATAQMGSVQGVLADALEWQGVNLDEYNDKLATMTTAEERAAYIQETLTDLYGESADAYRENNKALIENNEANLRLEKTLAEIGKVALPIMTALKDLAADLLEEIAPFVELIGEGLQGAFSGSADAGQKLADGLSGILDTVVEKVTSALPTVLNIITSMLPSVLSALTEALPKIVSAVVEIIPQITQALLEAMPEILSCILEIISSLLQQIGTLLPEIVSQIIEIVPMLIQELISAIPDLISAATEFLMAIVKAIPVLIEQLLQSLPTIIDTIINGILEALPLLLEASIQLFTAIIESIPVILDSLNESLPTIIETIIQGLISGIPMLLEGAIQLLMAIIDALPTIIQALVVNLPRIITTIITTLLQNLPLIIQASVQLFMGIIKAIPQIIVELIKNLPTIISSIVQGLTEGIPELIKAGGQLLSGLFEGLLNPEAIWEAVKGLFDGIVGGIKELFGIHSPSKVMADVIGKNLALGIGKGFEDNIDGVNDEIADAMNFDANANVNVNGKNGRRSSGVVVYQTNNYSQAHSRLELFKSKQQTAAAVRLAMGEV